MNRTAAGYALKRAVDPVMAAYAREVDAETIFTRINAISS